SFLKKVTEESVQLPDFSRLWEKSSRCSIERYTILIILRIIRIMKEEYRIKGCILRKYFTLSDDPNLVLPTVQRSSYAHQSCDGIQNDKNEIFSRDIRV